MWPGQGTLALTVVVLASPCAALLPILWLAAVTRRQRSGTVGWAPKAIISNPYWSEAMKSSGRSQYMLSAGMTGVLARAARSIHTSISTGPTGRT